MKQIGLTYHQAITLRAHGRVRINPQEEVVGHCTTKGCTEKAKWWVPVGDVLDARCDEHAVFPPAGA